MNLVVTLNPNGDPKVTVSPESEPVNPGTVRNLTFVRGEGQTFSFSSLTFDGGNFTTPVVTDTQITTTDNSGTGTFTYTLVVTQDGNPYNSTSQSGTKPNIHNM